MELMTMTDIYGASFLELKKSDGSFDVIASDIIDGTACDIRAMEIAMYLVKDSMRYYQDAQDVVDSFLDTSNNYRESMSDACHLMSEAKSTIVTAIDNFTNYPSIIKTLDGVLSLLYYYEAYIAIPAISEEQRKKNRNKGSSTYFFKNPATGLIKIGKSNDIKKRKQAVQCGSGVNLEVLAVVDSDIERELHKKFANHREHGEWFNDPDGEIESYIANIKKY